MASSPVLVQGRYLWKDGKRFFVRGVVYQYHDSDDFSLAGRDVISDDHLEQLQHDLRLFQELGVNAIYVYSIDYTKPHVQAMKMLEDAGIYVLISLASPQHCISRVDPYKSYNSQTLSAYFQTIDAMASFPNTLGALVADHLINDTRSECCAPVMKAVLRDVKKYIALRYQKAGQRRLPLGFGGHSYKDDRKVLNYMATGGDDRSIDFWTCNGFEMTGFPGTDRDGCEYLVSKHQVIDIPIFVSEYGSTGKLPRIFSETTTLYSPRMTGVFSGGCVYELWQGSNTYGLASLKRKIPSSSRRSAPKLGSVAETRETDLGTLSLFEDFVNYKARLASTAGIVESDGALVTGDQETARTADASLETGGIEGDVPESCVNWADVEEAINKNSRPA